MTIPSGAVEPCEHRALLDVQLDERSRELVEATAAERPGLLRAKDDDAERRLREALGRLDRRDDAERAVEAPGRRHRIQMRSAPDAGGAAPSVQVARRVDMRLEPGRAHPTGRQLVRRVLFVRVAGAMLGDRGDLVEPFGDPHQLANARSTRQPASGNSATTA